MSAQLSVKHPAKTFTAKDSASDCAAALTSIFKVTTIDPATMPLFLVLMDVAAGRTTPFPMADRYIGQRLARRSKVALEMEQGSDSDRARAKRFLNAWKLADAEQQRTGHRFAERKRGGLRGEDREKMRRVASTYSVPLVEIVPEVIRRARSSRAFYGPRRAEMYEQAARDVLSERPQDYQSEAASIVVPREAGSKTTKASSADTDDAVTREMKAHDRIVQAAVEKIKRLHLTEPDADALRHALHQQIEDHFAPLFADAEPGEVASGVYYSVSGRVLHADERADERADDDPEFPPFDLSEPDFSDESDAPADTSADVRKNCTPVDEKPNVYAGEKETTIHAGVYSRDLPPTAKQTSKATPSESLDPLTQALAYASFGWHVLPLHSWTGSGCTCGNPDCENAAKHPIYSLAPNGFKNATTDPATIKQWWTKAPFANIGIATGKVSDLLAVDVDPKHGGWESLHALFERLGEPFPPTVEAITGSGGRHFLFRMPEADIRNSAGKLGAGLDVRGNGGYIVAAPSLHKSGNRYQWTSDEAMLADLPYKLMLELAEPKRPERRHAPPTGFTPKAWTVGNIGEGSRNDTLFKKVACAARGRGAGYSEILDALTDARNSACDVGRHPVTDRELSKIADSAMRYPAGTYERRII
jgi:hypothetical protein